MSINAKRFEDYTKETNVPIADFLSGDAKSIWNSPNNEFKELSKDVEDFLKNLQGASGEVQDTIASGLREVKGMIPSVKDVLAMTGSELDELMGGIGFGDAADGMFKSLLSSLADDCKRHGGKHGRFGKPYKPTLDCNGKKKGVGGDCGTNGASAFGDALNKLTDGGFSAIVNDLNQILNAVIALASIGYNLKMCGVFGALSKMIPETHVLTRAAAGLLTNLNNEHNSAGILDLANSSGNLPIIIEKPDAVWDSMRNFRIPSDTRQNDYPDLSDRFLGAMELFDENYKYSSGDPNLLSINKIGSASDDFKLILDSSVKSKVYGSNDLDGIPDNDNVFLNTALQFA